MNRKLLNGLLVLAVAAGGVGTFTSCKDEDFRTGLEADVAGLSKHVQAICDVTDEQFIQNLERWLNDWTEDVSGENYDNFGSYEDMVGKLDKLYNAYKGIIADPQDYDNEQSAELVEGIYNWLYNQILPEESWFQNMIGDHTWVENLLQRASSISVSQTYNPVLGSFNLPVGVSSRILAGYVYKSNHSVEFPTVDYGNLSSEVQMYVNTTEYNKILGSIKTLIDETVTLEANTHYFTTPQDFGNMGGAVVTINPTSVDFSNGNYTLELVKSNGDVVLSSEVDNGLELEAYDDVLYFGATRADETTGVYALSANASSATFSDLEIDFDDAKSDVKNAFKKLIDDKSLSNLASLGATLFDVLKDKVPAYAVKLSWTEEEPTGELEQDANGNWVSKTEPVTNSVVSDFDIAAVVAHPLSYGTNLGSVVPSEKKDFTVSPLSEYLQNLSNKLELNTEEVEGVAPITLYVEVDSSTTPSTIRFYKVEDGNKVYIGEPVEYDNNVITLTDSELQALAEALVGGYNNEVINNSIIEDINDAIDNINKQISDLDASVSNIKEEIDDVRTNNRLVTYADKFIEYYNQVAEKLSDVLANPNHYLQVFAFYKGVDGAFHRLATDPVGTPVTYTSEDDAIRIYATSYNGDVVVPSYKKYVAITAVDGNYNNSNLKAWNEGSEYLNTVLPGQQHIVPLKLTSAMKGHVLTVTYLSVDYRGVASMQNYYISVQ